MIFIEFFLSVSYFFFFWGGTKSTYKKKHTDLTSSVVVKEDASWWHSRAWQPIFSFLFGWVNVSNSQQQVPLFNCVNCVNKYSILQEIFLVFVYSLDRLEYCVVALRSASCSPSSFVTLFTNSTSVYYVTFNYQRKKEGFFFRYIFFSIFHSCVLFQLLSLVTISVKHLKKGNNG